MSPCFNFCDLDLILQTWLWLVAATRPLLRQIDNLQQTFAAQTDSFERIEKNLTDRLSEFCVPHTCVGRLVWNLIVFTSNFRRRSSAVARCWKGARTGCVRAVVASQHTRDVTRGAGDVTAAGAKQDGGESRGWTVQGWVAWRRQKQVSLGCSSFTV